MKIKRKDDIMIIYNRSTVVALCLKNIITKFNHIGDTVPSWYKKPIWLKIFDYIFIKKI